MLNKVKEMERINFYELTQEERQQMMNEINTVSQGYLEKKVEQIAKEQKLLAENQKKTNTKISIMNTDMQEQKKILVETREKINNLRQPENTVYKKQLKRIVTERCYRFLVNNKHENYVLFGPYVFKSCYAAVANEVKSGVWENILVKDADNPNSQFQRACDFAEGWTPHRSTVLRWIDELKERANKDILREDRKNALDIYLSKHDINGNGPLLP